MDIQELMNRVAENLSVKRAFGAAYEKDGTLIIPVALVAGGGGAGEGVAPPPPSHDRSTEPAEDGHDHGEPSTGSGGGFGGVVLPVGAYVVEGEQVRWIPAVNVTLIALASLGLVRVLARMWSRGRRRRRR